MLMGWKDYKSANEDSEYEHVDFCFGTFRLNKNAFILITIHRIYAIQYGIHHFVFSLDYIKIYQEEDISKMKIPIKQYERYQKATALSLPHNKLTMS